ncbi:sel1 repeat family protein [Burkholderia gladioli]|uniref:sel1 repeat family protein n=1 Tax=Burkholderia gladioli TaxID=28095 RepID=UPI00163FDC2E|nr:sel1 repeat family protein [Burkholderia gladioli]
MSTRRARRLGTPAITLVALALVLAWCFARGGKPVRSSAPVSAPVVSKLGSTGASSFSNPDAPAGRAAADDAGPQLVGSSGRLVDLGGKTVVQYVDQYAGAARRGDADAAWHVYLAESVCAEAATRQPAGDAAASDSRASASREARLCANVSAAQVDERLQFLAQAARAGRGDAQVDYFIEGPFGQGSAALGDNPDDPRVRQWRGEAREHLRDAAGNCDPLAAGLLASAYGSGQFGAQDPATSIAYALLAASAGNGKWPRERLAARFGATLSAADFAAAYDQGMQQARQACPKAG